MGHHCRRDSYLGIVATIFEDLPFAEMQPNWTRTYGPRDLAMPVALFVLSLVEGGGSWITSLDGPLTYRSSVPRSGADASKGRLPEQAPVLHTGVSSSGPRVGVFAADSNGMSSP